MSEYSIDSFNCLRKLQVKDREYDYYSLNALAESGAPGTGNSSVHELPFSLKLLLENMLRHEDDVSVKAKDISNLMCWTRGKSGQNEICFHPSRILMQDFTGVPAICDLAAMRGAVERKGLDATLINPLSQVDLVVDHSVMVDNYGDSVAFQKNVNLEMQRNVERYKFLRWGQQSFSNFRVVPPGTGICHQVNLEYLAKVVWTAKHKERTLAYPDTLVGTDSHTTMVNGLGVLGWGVGGIEAEAAMLGQPVSMLIPDVVGLKLTGCLKEGITATDLVLTIVQMLRKHGVVGKFVEFYGQGLDNLPLADRATIANMAPEYGATCGIFSVDQETIKYLRLTGRDAETVDLVEAYCKAQGLWHDADTPDAVYSETLELDLGAVETSLAGPKRPQDRVKISNLKEAFSAALKLEGKAGIADKDRSIKIGKTDYELKHGDVVIAAITSCTNTSNPSVMLGAALLARNALRKGISVKPWVKTSLAPGSKVVTEYLEKSSLQLDLDALGFNLVGYGCTTCIGNSGDLNPVISKAIKTGDLMVCSVLSGNRNFEGRVHQEVRANWLASPPIVVAYALAGTVCINLEKEPLGRDKNGDDVFLSDIWPSSAEVQNEVSKVSAEMFHSQYADVFRGTKAWQAIEVEKSKTYIWPQSSYIKEPPFFTDEDVNDTQDIHVRGARVLAVLGDSVTTDHISPAGAIATEGPAGMYLRSYQIEAQNFNSFGSRRGNHEVMMRGTFANIRIQNEMVPESRGGFTIYHGDNKEGMSIYDAAMNYQKNNTPLVIFAGREYGTGSSRDWAAKGTRLLGVHAVIVESFERIHRSNLIGMGVLPLQFLPGQNRKNLKLDGSEIIDIDLPEGDDVIKVGQEVSLTITSQTRDKQSIRVLSRLDTENEISYYKSGGILQYVLQKLIAENVA